MITRRTRRLLSSAGAVCNRRVSHSSAQNFGCTAVQSGAKNGRMSAASPGSASWRYAPARPRRSHRRCRSRVLEDRALAFLLIATIRPARRTAEQVLEGAPDGDGNVELRRNGRAVRPT